MAGVGMVRLAADFGGGNGGGTVNTDEARARFAAIQAECDRDGLRYYDIQPGDSRLDVEAFARDIQRSLGLVYAHAEAGLAALPKSNPGPVDPPAPEPAALLGVCGSYPGHDPARDVYLGWTEEQVQWGPHHAFEIIAPKAGSVQALAFPTPLSVWQAMDADWRKELERFFADFVCWLPKAGDVVVMDAHVDPLQTMNVHAYTPDGGFPTRGGTIRLQVGAHVRQDIRVGRVAAQGVIAVVWDSGIRWEPSLNTRAAHYHSAPSQSGQLLPNGDMDGIYGCEMFGWQVQNIGRLPGPNDYQTGLYCAGRLLSDFTSAGRPIPPMPQ